MIIFSIAGVDLSKNILVPSYTVNSEDEYTAWKDGYGIEHREISRQRISGSFKMKFYKKSDYIDFLNMVNANKVSEGYIPVSLYVNNLNTVRNANVYLAMPQLSNTMPLYGVKEYDGFTVSVRER